MRDDGPSLTRGGGTPKASRKSNDTSGNPSPLIFAAEGEENTPQGQGGVVTEALALISKCRDLGLILAPGPQGKLRVSPPGRLPEELRAELRRHKAEVLIALQSPQPAEQPTPQPAGWPGSDPWQPGNPCLCGAVRYTLDPSTGLPDPGVETWCISTPRDGWVRVCSVCWPRAVAVEKAQ